MLLVYVHKIKKKYIKIKILTNILTLKSRNEIIKIIINK